MRIHFIGMGERIMGDLATNLDRQGHKITGSDVSFSETTLHNLQSAALMPELLSWFPKKIQAGLDKVIIGTKIQPDNPELQAAQRLGLPIWSYPQYIQDYAQDKQRIVITGGKEKTLLCVLVLHVLKHLHKEFDYIVDSPKLRTSVQLSDAPIIILEGNIEPASLIDAKPQILYYQHNIALVSGIGWESSNTHPTLETYLTQITKLADATPKGGTLIYYEEDSLVEAIGKHTSVDVKVVPYKTHPHRYVDQQAYTMTPKQDITLQDTVSMGAVAGAQQLLYNLAVSDQQFYEALTTFLVD